MSRSTTSPATIVTLSVPPLPGDFGSTAALLTMEPLASGSSTPVTRIGGTEPPTGSTSVVVHVTRWPLISHDHPLPTATVGVIWLGTTSVRVAPLASAGPSLVTSMT